MSPFLRSGYRIVPLRVKLGEINQQVQSMMFLKVPYAEKDKAKALGARWNAERKAWYIPDGTAATPFEQWLTGSSDVPAAAAAKGSGKVDSYVGKPTVGAHYFDLEHDCSPFTECAQCRPKLESSGWLGAHDALKAMIAAL
jgi:hypothetical protein